MNLVVITAVVLGILGLVSAVVLYFLSQKFRVVENPKIAEVEALLPGANCGGCGFAGCHALAEALAKADDLEGLTCPVGGAETMKQIAAVLGKAAAEAAPKVAVLRCNGTCQNRPKTHFYDGAPSCAVAAQHFAGDTACSFGCLGLGDCAAACSFGGIHLNPETGIVVVDEDRCTACGACVKACPKNLIELRNRGPKNRRIWVACQNTDKGAIARKACSAACIGCGKCQKECAFDAIKVENNVAYIDYQKCRICRKCVAVCPTHAICEANFPPKPAPAAEAQPKTEA